MADLRYREKVSLVQFGSFGSSDFGLQSGLSRIPALTRHLTAVLAVVSLLLTQSGHGTIVQLDLSA